jgi:hypothetical protein
MGGSMSLGESDRAAIREALGRIRKKLELVGYHLDSTETAQDAIGALQEARQSSSQVVTDIGMVIERIQARQES